MRQSLLTLVVTLLIAACGSDSSLPEATGKGTIRAINANPTAPEVGFLIEETVLDGMLYKDMTTPRDWDDLEYTFNFEYRPPGIGAENERVASELLNVTANTEYTFLFWGDLNAPTITIWQKPIREFGGSDTVFELRIANAAASLGMVDVYVAADGVAPALGQQNATVAQGEISAATDFDSGEYVVTVTPAGDPATILFQSGPTILVERQSNILAILDGDANDPAPLVTRLYNQAGSTAALPDSRFAPTVRFFHGTMNLDTSDIYDDEAVTNQIFAGLAFGEATGDIDVGIGDIPFTLTAENNPGAILYERNYITIGGTRLSIHLFFVADEIVSSAQSVNRRSIETEARLTWFHSADNHEFVDLYVVDRGELIDEALPRQIGLLRGLLAPPIVLGAGSYDIYVTTAGEKTILDGPIAYDAALGDVHEAILLNRVDPALAEFRFIPLP